MFDSPFDLPLMITSLSLHLKRLQELQCRISSPFYNDLCIQKDEEIICGDILNYFLLALSIMSIIKHRVGISTKKVKAQISQ